MEGLLNPAGADVDPRLDLALRQPVVGGFQRRQNLFHLVPRGKRASDEVARDLRVLPTAEQHAAGRFQRPPGAAHLLIVGHAGAGCLIVDDECQIRLVESHAKGRGRHQRLHVVVEQRLLQRLPGRAGLAGVGRHFDVARQEPGRDHLGVSHRQRVDDTAPRQRRQSLGQPGEAFSLTGHADGLERQRRPIQIAPQHLEVRSQDRLEISHHASVGGGGGRQQAKIGRQDTHGALDQTIVGAEVVAPVGDAVGLVDDEQCDALGDVGQHLVAESLVRQSLRGDEQDVHRARAGRLLHAVPLVLVVRVDRLGADAHPLGRGDLVAHQGQQGADQEGRPKTRFAQQPSRDEVDEALSPARLLYHELSAAAFDEVSDGFFLSLAEPGVLPPRAPLQELQGSGRVVVHVGGRVGVGGQRRHAASRPSRNTT